MRFRLTLALVAGVACACSAGDESAAPPEPTLSQLGLFADPVKQTPAAGVIPYDVISVLYADESSKLRFLRVPAGRAAIYDDAEPWQWPDGTQFIKTFYFPKDAREPSAGWTLLETRIVEREAEAWTARTYVWNAAQTDAVRLTTGTRIDVSWIDAQGATQTLEYRVPNENQCASCHARHHVMGPLGPRTRQLNRTHDYGKGPENEIDHLAGLAMVSGTIPPPADRPMLSDPYGADPLDARARSYLEGNCAHCHRPGGNAGASGLDLEITSTDPLALGVCRVPSAAGAGSGGHTYDIVPGDPADSIMIFRMSSTDAQLKMPQLPTVTADGDGVKLVTDWITAMPAMTCAP